MHFILRFIFRATVLLPAGLSCVRASEGALPSLASSPIIRSWGTEAGLPQNTVTSMVQSPDGYLWLGTRDGLARFDGVRFKVFTLESGLPNVDISCLFEDRQGVLWIGTYGGGLCRLRQGRIETVSDPGHHPGSDAITCLQEDATGRLWVGTAGGLRFFRDGKWAEDASCAGLPESSITCLRRSGDGATMWIASVTSGLMSYREGHLDPCPGPTGHEKIFAQSLLEDSQCRLWAGIGNGMVLCREKGRWRIFSETNGLPFAYITSLAEDPGGTIWAGSLDDGLYRFDGARFNVIRKTDGLSAEDIRSLYCDPEGNLWVGTRTGGLNCLSKRHLLAMAGAQGLTDDFTRSVAETVDGTLWVGTIGGSLYQGGLSGFHPFRPDPVGPLIYHYAHVDSVLAMPDGSLWWGSAGGALMRWKNNRLANCFTNEPWLRNASVTALQNDHHDGIWIGTSGGQLLHWQEGHFTALAQQPARAAITSLAVEADDSVWIGSLGGGVKRIQAGGEEVLSILHGLPSASIRTLHLDADGALWIGTTGGGLSVWRKGQLTSFSSSQGLTMRTVSQIVEDDCGFLWMGCNSGIFKVKKKDLLDCADGRLAYVHSRSFGINDGMWATECSGGFCPAGLKTQSGLICISTVRGLVFLNPNEPGDDTAPPQVLLEEVLVNGRVQEPVTAGGNAGSPPAPRIIIPPGIHDLALHYTAIHFSAPEKIGFRYRLEGWDRGWSEVFARRTAYYQYIPPGEYTLHLQACNADGVWGSQDTTLAVTALPFFWETTWFRATTLLAGSLLMAGMLWGLLRHRYRRRLARLQTLNAIERERLRIAKDMHDQIGGMLTQMSQLSDLGLNEMEDPSLLRNRFERIGNRARVAVQSLDEIVWATNPKNDNLASFAEYVSRFSDEFFECTRIRCWQEVPATLPPLPLRTDVRHNVFLAVREAFNNALKHSQGTEVWLRMKLDHRRVTLDIEDNGCGFTPGQVAPGGNGLGNMRTRLAEDGGETVVISAPGRGTCIRFIFTVTS